MQKYKSKSNILAFISRHFSGNSIDYHQVAAMFVPMLIDQAFIVCMGFINTAMISSSGVSAVSAVNMVDSLNMFLINAIIAVATGGTVVVAQYKGAGNDKLVSSAAAATISSVFLLAFAIGALIGVFNGQTLSFLFSGAAPDVFDKAKIYMIGSCTSYCGIAVEEAVCGALRGIGESRSSLGLSFIMNFTYLILNAVFINGLHMGVLGMTVSVNISRYFGAACAIFYLVRINETLGFRFGDLFCFNPAMLKKIFFIGLPYAAEQLFFNGGKMLTQTFIVKLGTYAIAINAICNSIAGLTEIPANAICLTAVTVVGQCIGQRNIGDARKFIRSFVITSSITFALMNILILPLFTPLVSLFNPPRSIVPTIFQIIIINNIIQIPLWSISFVMPSALRAAGDSKFTSIVAMLSMWLFRVVFGYILGVILHFGILGVWIAMDCEWGIRGVVFCLRFHGKKWYSHHIVD